MPKKKRKLELPLEKMPFKKLDKMTHIEFAQWAQEYLLRGIRNGDYEVCLNGIVSQAFFLGVNRGMQILIKKRETF